MWLATTPLMLILARVLQGIGGALVTPGSLSMIQGSFAPVDRLTAIGAWSGLGGVAAAIGPFVGGVLIDYASWRWIFLINVPLALATIVLARRWVPESRDLEATGRYDVPGAALAAAALAGTTYALIEWGSTTAGVAGVAGVAGIVTAVSFVVVERRSPHPMVPLALFGCLTFSSANAMTLLVYAALGAVAFFVVFQSLCRRRHSACYAADLVMPNSAGSWAVDGRLVGIVPRSTKD